MPITVPVPAEYAKPYDAHNPSTYNSYVAFTGPYMVQNTASGALSGYRPGGSIQLVRNPNWVAATDYRPAYLTSILIRTNATNTSAAARQVAAGRDLLFDNINVRKAVMAGFDRVAARRARGGADVGDIATHFLPPDLPGFAEAGGYDGFPDIDYFNKDNASGNRALAAKYFKAAGYKSGKYEGNEQLLVVGANADPGKAQAEVASAQLQKMGFKTRLRLVPQDAVYTDWCQVPSKKVAMCGGAGWFKDFADPQSMLEPIFKGSLISRDGGNLNYSMLDDRKVDAAMDAAAMATGDERLRQWAAIDKMLIGDAAAIPFLWDKTTLLHAPNVASVPNPYIALWDLSFTSITP
jgi:peptide/nickel transport system substrate-binding protein